MKETEHPLLIYHYLLPDKLLKQAFNANSIEAINLSRIFHHPGRPYNVKADEQAFPDRLTQIQWTLLAFAGAGGIFPPLLRANSRGYWLGAGSVNLLANLFTIIPRPGEISGLDGRINCLGGILSFPGCFSCSHRSQT